MQITFERMNRMERAFKKNNTPLLVLAVASMMLFSGYNTMNAQTTDQTCHKSLAVLQQAVLTGETFFIKVHAAENLIHHGKTDGLETQFLQLQQASPENAIGAARVLARLNRAYPVKYQQYIAELLNHVLHGSNDKMKLTALESLGKLGYHSKLPVIQAYADTSTDGFRGMARWIGANSNEDADEDRLSELLLSANKIDYRYAAYALRFKKSNNATTISRLMVCLERLAADDAARVYVASCLFVHGGLPGRKIAAPLLQEYATADVGQRYEVAEAFGLGGNTAFVPLLQQLLADENTDVRVAAANALLNVLRCE